MREHARLVIVVAALAAAMATLPAGTADAQRRPPPRRGQAVQRAHPVNRAVVVFVGGYFYDPFFGPYPWWPRTAYPYPYYPMYAGRAEVRVLVTPREAAVYVDGFYAGIVDDFNGFFQGLGLPPGGHEIVLYREGYRTVRQRIYLGPASTFKLRYAMERLPPGERSEPPTLAPPIPPPPDGTFAPPRTPRTGAVPPPPPQPGEVAPLGTLALRVQPANAAVTIDGERWASSDGEHFVIQLPAGAHRVEVVKTGYQPFSTQIEVRDGETATLNVSLTSARPE